MFLNMYAINDWAVRVVCGLGVVTDEWKCRSGREPRKKRTRCGCNGWDMGVKGVLVGEKGVGDGGRGYVTWVDRVGAWGD